MYLCVLFGMSRGVFLDTCGGKTWKSFVVRVKFSTWRDLHGKGVRFADVNVLCPKSDAK